MIINKATFDGNDFVYQPGIGISIDNQNIVSSDIADMLMIKHTLSNGYYDTSGRIQTASAVDAQKYTNKIAVLEGEQIRVKYNSEHLPTGAKMWLAYATFDANGTFKERIEVLTPTVKKGFDETITIGKGVSYISLMFSSFSSYGAYTFTPLAMFNSIIQLVADIKRDTKIEEGTTAVSVGTWKWRKHSNGYVECSIYFNGSVTAQNQQGSMYYSNVYTWAFPFKLTQLHTINGVVGNLGYLANPTISGLYTDSPSVGFRLAFPTAKESVTTGIILSVSGWIA